MKYPYQDASLPVEQRVEDLLSRMSLEEKFTQIRLYRPKEGDVKTVPFNTELLEKTHTGLVPSITEAVFLRRISASYKIGSSRTPVGAFLPLSTAKACTVSWRITAPAFRRALAWAQPLTVS